MSDGTSNTAMVVETADPVPWAKPGDLLIEPGKPIPKFAGPGGTFNVLMADGSVRRKNLTTVSEKTLRNAFLRNDGNLLGSDW